MPFINKIIVSNSRVHNLKNASCEIPHGVLCCMTGISGSGKSSLAFDTIFIEGQRRYVQSLSHHAQSFIGNLPKPDVDSIDGLTPTICIQQKTSRGSPRSTVGTATEIYDYLRLLYAKVAIPYCPISGERLQARSRKDIVESIFSTFSMQKVVILSPFIHDKKGELKDDLAEIERKGYTRVRLDGSIVHLDDVADVDPTAHHTVDIVVDRLEIVAQNHQRLTESIFSSLDLGTGIVIVLNQETGNEELYSENAYSIRSKKSYPALQPNDFSFNHTSGMCSECQGLGVSQVFLLESIIDPKKSIAQDCCCLATSYQTVQYKNIYDNLAFIYKFSVDTPWEKLEPSTQNVLLHGSEKRFLRMVFINPNTGSTWTELVQWKGWLHAAKTKYHSAKSTKLKKHLEQFMRIGVCQSCHASRLKPYPSATKYCDLSIHELTSQSISEAIDFFASRKDDRTEYEGEIIAHIQSRLQFLQEVGLGYISLNRRTDSLSGGEFQRVRLASQIGSNLSGVTYVLDEPSIGLHPIDNDRLIKALHFLKQQGNTVIVVEHDEQTIRQSDYIIDVGPRAGVLGGEILYQGPLKGFRKKSNSLTSDYLFGRKMIAYDALAAKKPEKFVSMLGVRHRNLNDVDLHIPVNRYTAIVGVSGSGKSSLIIETLYPALSNHYHRSELEGGSFTKLKNLDLLDKVIHIDQSPIGRTPRSNPATYSGLFDDIRDLFASLPDSKSRGFTASRFSFNTKVGVCPNCVGLGSVPVDMDFLDESWIDCPTCKTMRYSEETLQIRFKDKTISDVLSMTVAEAMIFFSAIPSIHRRLTTLSKVGLEYITLGQSATTLSGGEAQRLKLARELSRPATEKTLYILDEPSTGLHFHDIQMLLTVLKELIERGNSVVIIEHNMELVKTADWVIELGPGAGLKGGKIIAQAPPEEFRKLDTPSGKALEDVLSSKYSSYNPSESLVKKDALIHVKGARQNNLKNFDLQIEKERLIALVGPSGAGKSSLAFDTIFAEGQRHYVETLSPYARQYIEQLPKPDVDCISGLCPTIAVERRLHASSPRSTLGTLSELYDYLRILFARAGSPHCPKTGHPIVRVRLETVADLILSWKEDTTVHVLAPCDVTSLSHLEHQIEYWKKQGITRIRLNKKLYNLQDEIPLPKTGRRLILEIVIDRFRPKASIRSRLLGSLEFAAQVGHRRIILLKDSEEKTIHLDFSVLETGDSYPPITAQTFAFNSEEGWCETCYGWGILHTQDADEEEPTEHIICPACDGSRLNPLARAVTLKNETLPSLCAKPLQELLPFFKELTVEKSLQRVLDEIVHRLELSTMLGIGYLSLDRRPSTLSNGEAQRVEFVNKLGSQLSGLLYLIDEPTKGLHPIDILTLLDVVNNLVRSGNTVLAIEHDPLFIQQADHIIELGPGGGTSGGQVLFDGSTDRFYHSKNSPTAKTLLEKISLPPTKKSTSPHITVEKARLHNLTGLSCSIPTKAVVGIIGVSGSGKSTLVFDIIAKAAQGKLLKKNGIVRGLDAFSRIITIDQKPIGRTNRSDVATFTDVYTHLRQWYAGLPHAKTLGLMPAHFSTFHHKGMCKHCYGQGYTTVDLHFLPSHRQLCTYCNGLRLNPLSLSVEYKGFSLGKLLQCTIDELQPMFSHHKKISAILQALSVIGLGYLKLGQEMVSLSPGEVQRIVLAIEIARSRRGTTLYLFDEPTTGLHINEVINLNRILHELAEEGHTVIVVEHHLHIISSCNYLIELGPKAGPEGGAIIAQGGPKELVQNTGSQTGPFLKPSKKCGP